MPYGLRTGLRRPTPSKALQEFETISKRIVDIHAVVARQRLIVDDNDLRVSKTKHQLSKVLHEKTGVSLTCGPKLSFHSQVDLHVTRTRHRRVSRDGTA